jgi:hypothetical protein
MPVKKAARTAKDYLGTARTNTHERLAGQSATRTALTLEGERFHFRARNGGTELDLTYSQKSTQSELLWASGLDGFNLGIANTAARVLQLTNNSAK